MVVTLARGLVLAGCAALLLTTRVLAQSYSLGPSIANGSLGSEWSAFQANPNGFTSSYSITTGSYLTLNNREWLSLSNPLPPGNTPITVAGTFEIGNAGDFLTVALHTDADTTRSAATTASTAPALPARRETMVSVGCSPRRVTDS